MASFPCPSCIIRISCLSQEGLCFTQQCFQILLSFPKMAHLKAGKFYLGSSTAPVGQQAAGPGASQELKEGSGIFQTYLLTATCLFSGCFGPLEPSGHQGPGMYKLVLGLCSFTYLIFILHTLPGLNSSVFCFLFLFFIYPHICL